MPRIDPLKLLVCLSVLLAPNGGIRSANEVKRLANLMAKFSKKLVSKCIYIQILKCTETELLGQFMAAGGWSLVHMWLADGITTKNWPLTQELLELLLCCPVDVERLKSNTAPKLVKSLSKDSSHEGVRLLASKLVEQWLKIARNDIRSSNPQQTNQPSQLQSAVTPQSGTKEDNDCEMQEEEDEVQETNQEVIEVSQDEETMVEESILPDDGPIESESEQHQEQDDGNCMVEEPEVNEGSEKDADESNAKKSPLLFKITMKNGKQMLAKVESPTKGDAVDGNEMEVINDEKSVGEKKEKQETVTAEKSMDVDENESTGKLHKDDDSKSKGEKHDESDKEKDRRKSLDGDRNKDKSSSSKDKDRNRDKDRRSSSSSSSHRSSSKHNSSNSSSSSSSRSKSSSSGSSSKSSSSSSRDKDKEKDRHSSSSSKSHHKSSSSSSTSQKSSSSKNSSSSSSEKHREHRDKDRERDKSNHSSKDKDGQSKLISPSISKLSKISRKSKDSEEEKSDSSSTHKSSPISASKKASISIEVRNAEHRPKTVKTYNSQFRSHGLIEEAPPPPSRKGLKKPSQTPTTPPVIGSTATGTIPPKRSSPPPFTREGPPEKRLREDLAERPGAIKLIPAKRQPSLVESDMFMDALSATLKKDVKKRKRRPSGSESTKSTDKPASATSPVEKSAPGSVASPDKSATTPAASTGQAGDKTSQQPSSPTGSVPTAAVSNGPSSPAKVIAAPMSFYRDTLADSEENAEEKKEAGEEEDSKEKIESPEVSGDVEMKTDETIDTPAEPDEMDDEVIKKPKRLKSELIDDDEAADDKGSLIDAVGDDLTKKMAMLEGGEQTEVPDIPVKKPPGPGCGPDGPPGVLVIHRRKGPKKQLKWKTQDDLEEIRYFELDVTERCNVTKTFTDLKQMERVDERQKYILSRKLQTEDVMVERTAWLPLIVVDNVPPHPDGVNSVERRLQRDRERTVLQALYFNRHMIPDSPSEPDVEVYSISEPAHIPMEDVTGNPDSVNDFTSMPWPEPKSTPPNESAGFNSPFFPGSGNDFPSFGSPNSWDMPGAGPGSGHGPIPSLFAPGRIPVGMPPGNNGPPSGPNMMRQMNMPPNMPPNMPHPHHSNMFPNNFVRGPPPPPMQHMLDADEDNFRGGPPPPPNWFNNNRGPPPHMSGNYNHNRGGFGNNRGGNNWNNNNNNRDNDRGGPRGGNYRPPWLQNRGNHRGGRKW
ncbi:serine-rich adhesin for platelets [Toxorhynchites rutilus septentrionalis]|uniref:serine-rich adhesin for platelets n=1 Tax=Toxorhynchites rutilus septentrionalis TaxID=329112 RepID=UPI0024793C70|nr:serine-rich adhesin for platelets [Toxorhynchites rutilus septentrionalis]